MKIQKLVVVAVVFAGLLVYHNSFRDAFVFDDVQYITENPRIRQLWPPWHLLGHSSRPVVHLSLAVNYALGGLNPWGYHLFNVAVHILAALTLYGVVRRTLLSKPLRSMFGGASSSLAGAIALIWLVHPLQTEIVTFTIQRGESLMSLFYLMTLYGVIRSDNASRGNLWKIAAVVSCALGMACKPVMVTAPLVTLLYDRAFLSTSWRDIRQRRAWLYAGLAASWLLLPPLLANAPTEWKASAGFAFRGIPPLQYAQMEPAAIMRYLRLAFWPRPLCLDYGWEYHWREMVNAGNILPDLIVVTALLVATVWAWSRKPALGFLGAWFFLILAPTSSFMPIADPIAEHRMYLPLAAVVTVVVLVAFVLGKRLLGNQSGFVVGWVACGFAVVSLAILTIQRNRDYISGIAIWEDTVAKSPQNPRAHHNLGFVLSEIGDFQEAINQYEQALRIEPDYAEAHHDLGFALSQTGKLPEAIGEYEEALRLMPEYVKAHNNLGVALTQTGRLAEGIGQYEEALRLDPDYAEVHYNLGIALEQTGKLPEAIGQYEEALRLMPEYVEAHYNLGNDFLQEGKVSDAIAHYAEALRIKPEYAEAHSNLGVALAQAGKIEDAIEQYEEALRFKPDYAEAHSNLGAALEQAGRVPEAIQHYKQALGLRPDLTAARNALARLQGSQ